MAFDKAMACVNPPGDFGNLAPDQRIVIVKIAAADRDVSLAIRKIERSLLHDQFDADARMPQMKLIEESRFDDALADARMAGQLD